MNSRTRLCWHDTAGLPCPQDDARAAARWLVGRHPHLAQLLECAAAVDLADPAEPWPDLEALAAGIAELHTTAQAWERYEQEHPAPRDGDTYARWRGAGPQLTSQAARAMATMSTAEVLRLHLLATLSRDGATLRGRELSRLDDKNGSSLLEDWITAVRSC